MATLVTELTNSYCSNKLEGRQCDVSKGKGLFARANIDTGELLVVWGGSAVPWAVVKGFPLEHRRRTLQVDDELFLFSDREGPADWVNHSCRPNGGMSGQVSLVAIRPIFKGDEVTMDYAFCDSLPYDEFDCSCGARNCRGRVSADDWRRPELQDRYFEYFSPYLQRRILAFNNGSARGKAHGLNGRGAY